MFQCFQLLMLRYCAIAAAYAHAWPRYPNKRFDGERNIARRRSTAQRPKKRREKERETRKVNFSCCPLSLLGVILLLLFERTYFFFIQYNLINSIRFISHFCSTPLNYLILIVHQCSYFQTLQFIMSFQQNLNSKIQGHLSQIDGVSTDCISSGDD